jgi:hypothetical protein
VGGADVITHEFRPDPFGRDACDSKEDDAEAGRVAHCGRPRSEHMDEVHGLRVQLATALKERDEARAHPFDKRCADALADEVDVLIQRHVIDFRSPAADALLDYRNPPRTPRSDRLAKLEVALTDLLKLIDEGMLVRNIEADGQPGWTLKAMRLVMALKHAYALAPALVAPAVGEEGKR